MAAAPLLQTPFNVNSQQTFESLTRPQIAPDTRMRIAQTEPLFHKAPNRGSKALAAAGPLVHACANQSGLNPEFALCTLSLLAISSIFFLVDPFAAIPSFLAITADADGPRTSAWLSCRSHMLCRSHVFALAGKLIFSLFGITLPAFEIAGGLILLLIGIDMLEAKRSPTQESSSETEEAASKKMLE